MCTRVICSCYFLFLLFRSETCSSPPCLNVYFLFAYLVFLSWRRLQRFPLNRRYISTRVHRVTEGLVFKLRFHHTEQSKEHSVSNNTKIKFLRTVLIEICQLWVVLEIIENGAFNVSTCQFSQFRHVREQRKAFLARTQTLELRREISDISTICACARFVKYAHSTNRLRGYGLVSAPLYICRHTDRSGLLISSNFAHILEITYTAQWRSYKYGSAVVLFHVQGTCR
jgi:hypothetical protein